MTEKTGTASAARRHGCVCPPAVAAYEVQLARKRVSNDGPGRGARAEWMAELNRRTALRRHGNPREQMAAGLDPREPWRGPSCRVDRLTVDFPDGRIPVRRGTADHAGVSDRDLAAPGGRDEPG
jgi:hypothetical protein